MFTSHKALIYSFTFGCYPQHITYTDPLHPLPSHQLNTDECYEALMCQKIKLQNIYIYRYIYILILNEYPNTSCTASALSHNFTYLLYLLLLPKVSFFFLFKDNIVSYWHRELIICVNGQHYTCHTIEFLRSVTVCKGYCAQNSYICHLVWEKKQLKKQNKNKTRSHNRKKKTPQF